MRNFSTGALYASSVFGAAPVILFHSFPPYASAASSIKKGNNITPAARNRDEA